ncbi:hypothetical protein [Planomonospora parontospora]|uniref:hypothetical protein n=1 Tax=Planomonospora parontospora TaxID=58119 RepID=UPI00166FFC63|nr:hypothetical protein [Planomonospora parontospora]GGL45639.1 hypothetical protein GCM10014719_53700 [Planomonospora parontospora subsp. antibiotica]GII18653.1 hypothetical protein Ppa05_53790 [Planomonospora parontospora subsp. antibiotica]
MTAGGTVLIAASVLWLGSRIYWPEGVVTALGLALGAGLLAVASTGRTPPEPATG